MGQTERSKLFAGEPNEKVADVMAGCCSSSENDQMAKAEFYLRQTDAIMKTTAHTQRYTRYMLWSVVVLALTSMVQILVTLLKWYFVQKT